MPVFEIQGPDGKTYELDAPDQNAAIAAISGIGASRKSSGGYDGDVNGGIGSTILGALDGASFGFADEIGAGINAGVDSLLGKGVTGRDPKSYEQWLAKNRGLQANAQDNHDSAYLGGQIAGSVIAPLKGGPLLAGRGSNLAMKGLGYAGEGAIYGGLNGAGAAEEGGRLQGAFNNGLMGAGIGVAAPVAVSAIGRAAQPVVDAVKGSFGPAPSQAVNRVVAAMRGTGMDDAGYAARLDDLGPDAMLVDAMGERGQALGRAAANVSPDARSALETVSNARMAMQPERFVGVLEGASGLSVGNRQTVEALKDAAFQKVAPDITKAYNEARFAGQELPLDDFKEIMASPMGKQAFGEAEKSIQNRVAAGDLLADSDLSFLDAAKRRLDAQGSVALRSGDNDTAGQAQSLARAIRERTDKVLDDPIYAEARSLRQNAYRTDEAFDAGQELAGTRISLDAPTRAAAAAKSNGPAVAQGYGAELAEAILNRRGTPGALDRLNAPMQRDAMRTALGENAKLVEDQLARERVFGQTHRSLTGNSTTARQLKEMGAVAGVGAGLGYYNGADPFQAGAIGIAAALARKGAGAAATRLRSGNEERVAKEIAKLLVARGVPTTPEGVKVALKNPERAKAIANVAAALGASIQAR